MLDTTLRDGAQTKGISFTLNDKLKITEVLDDLGIDIIEAGWPGSNPKDSEFFKVVKEVKLSHSKIAAFGSTRRAYTKVIDDLMMKSILDSEVPVAVIFGKAWPLHVKEVLHCSEEENKNMIADSISYLKDHGLEVIFDAEHFFDGWKESSSYALDVLRVAYESGARTVVLCDTNGGTLPTEIREIVRQVRKEFKGPLGIHAHNDTGVAVANSLVAVEEGIRHVQGTMIGLGERCGNADLTILIPTLSIKLGYDVLKGKAKEKLKRLTEIANHIGDLLNVNISPSHPYIGRHAFAHKAGVHVDAVLKNPRTYEHIDPSLIGNERLLSISELSGRSALLYHAEKLGIKISNDELIKALREIKELESKGYQLEAADATIALIILKSIGQLPKFFDVRTWWVETLNVGKVFSRAIVSLDINDETITVIGEGVGPVHALDEAIRSAISKKFPMLANVKLINYKVTVLDSNDGTAATVRVYTEFLFDNKNWATTAVSRNIIEASLKAILDGYIYLLATMNVKSNFKHKYE
ncbi:MAG: citramalate synthase [Nitrososphaerota archaeon]